MKVVDLFEDTIVSVVFSDVIDARKQMIKFVMLSPIYVEAYYCDYPSIDTEAQKFFDTLFRKFKAKRTSAECYEFTLDGSGELQDMIEEVESYFNEPGYNEPGFTWPFSFEVKA